MKKHIITLFVLVLMLVVLPINAFATTLDGLQIDIRTDAEEYESHEPIKVTYTITNTNDDPVTNLSLEHAIPSGYTAAGDAILKKSIELHRKYVSYQSDPSGYRW